MDWIASEVRRIQRQLTSYVSSGKRLIVSSSFQSHSLPLLHMVGRMKEAVPVYFINTGFHFAKTMEFVNQVSADFGLHTIRIESATEKLYQKDELGRFLFVSDPSTCCYLNKTLPMNELLKTADVWVSGVRKDQTANRSAFREEMEGPYDTIRYHPVLNWDSKMVHEYRLKYNLPTHPLEAEGYLSVGCEPCTSKYLGGERSARWNGQQKEECGLHIDLIKE